jgi:hypothetical protein
MPLNVVDAKFENALFLGCNVMEVEKMRQRCLLQQIMIWFLYTSAVGRELFHLYGLAHNATLPVSKASLFGADDGAGVTFFLQQDACAALIDLFD